MSKEQDWTAVFGQWMSGAVPGMPSMPGVPGMGSWATPTLSVEELDKRIQDLKSVQFWLEQNSRALTATVQALEVQKMTLSTLQGMNVNLADLAQAFMPKAGATAATGSASPKPAAQPEPASPGASTGTAPGIDPLQLWNGLAQQFQSIASTAMQEAMRHVPPAAAAPAANPAPAKKTTRTRRAGGAKSASEKR